MWHKSEERGAVCLHTYSWKKAKLDRLWIPRPANTVVGLAKTKCRRRRDWVKEGVGEEPGEGLGEGLGQDL